MTVKLITCEHKRCDYWNCIFHGQTRNKYHTFVTEDCTLPHVFCRILPDSSGFQQTPPDSNPGMCWCDKGQIGMLSPGGVRWSPPEYGEFRRSPRNSIILFRWADSTGIRWNLLDSIGLHQTPSDSSRFHRTPSDSSRFQQTPTDYL